MAMSPDRGLMGGSDTFESWGGGARWCRAGREMGSTLRMPAINVRASPRREDDAGGGCCAIVPYLHRPTICVCVASLRSCGSRVVMAFDAAGTRVINVADGTKANLALGPAAGILSDRSIRPESDLESYMSTRLLRRPLSDLTLVFCLQPCLCWPTAIHS